MRLAGALVLAVAALARIAHADCGEERALVKLGKDADARKVATDPVEATIAELVLRPRPRKTPESRRAADDRNTELTVWQVSGTVTGYKLEADGDYHVVLADEHGTTMIVELPDPGCAATGAWPEQILHARAAFRQILANHKLPSPGNKLHSASLSVTVTGVGFFDKIHGQVGVAANGIELHPVLGVVSGDEQ